MRRTISLQMWLLAAFLTLVSVSTVPAAGSGVQDAAGFFSNDARAMAEQQIAALTRQFGKDLRVETYASIPPELAAQYAPEKKEAFFASWAYQRGKAAGVDGVIVLISKEPAFLQVAVGERTQQQAFTLANRDHLRDILLTAFRQKRFDDGLLQATTYYGTTLQANLGTHGTSTHPSVTSPSGPSPSPQAPQPGPRSTLSVGRLLFWGVLILVGLGLFAWLFRRPRGGPREYRNRPSGYGYPTSDSRYGDRYGSGWGGGFGRGFGGGILGGLLVPLHS